MPRASAATDRIFNRVVWTCRGVYGWRRRQLGTCPCLSKPGLAFTAASTVLLLIPCPTVFLVLLPVLSAQSRWRLAHSFYCQRGLARRNVAGMTPVTIRPYAPSDITACVGIFDRAWRAGHPFAPRRIDPTVFATETEGEMLFVAEDDGKEIAGFASLYQPESFIHHLYVEPRLRNRGLGSALLAHAVAAAGGSASLKCQLGNPAALGFYRHLGWTEIVAGTNEFGAWVTLRSPDKRTRRL